MDYYDINELVKNLDIMINYKRDELSKFTLDDHHDIFNKVKLNQLQYEITELEVQRKYYYDSINDINNCTNGCCCKK